MAAARPVPVRLTVNGEETSLTVEPGTVLLSVVRGILGLRGTKGACDRGECGACTVLIDAVPRMSCITLAGTLDGASVETIEGIAERTSGLRAAFADHGGYQCGFCTPGQVVTASTLLHEDLDDTGIRRRMAGNICRCTGYSGIVAAVDAASR